MLLPRRTHRGYPFLLPCLLGLVTVIFLCGEFVNAQNYSDSPPRYNYHSLPRTSFTCKGRLPGRYYPDPETDCQMFHVCVKMNSRDVQDFKFLCPNGTVFDAEHQVCIDFYQVVCHQQVGTNPLGHIFEIYKLSADKPNRDLDADKLSFVNRDSVQKNTLGDDFQVEEYNNNRLASSQNALNFRPSPEAPPRRTNKQKEDIFFNNKASFVPSTYQSPSTTRRTTTTSTSTTTTTTEAPSSSTPRRPSLETFESYETESFSGFVPTRNSFGRGHDPTPDFDASTEDFTTKDERPFRTQPSSTTSRPLVFQNTFRTTLSHVPPTSKPSAQTFQQQPTRFNDQYFTRIPSTTRRPVSKAAQFFRHTTSADDYFTPEYRQPTVNPFVHQSKSTTIRPNVVFQGNSGTLRPSANTDFQYETTTTTAPTTTTTTDFPTTTEYFSRQRQTEDFEARQTTTYNTDFTQSARNSNFFNLNNENKPRKQEFGGKSQTATQRQFPPQLSSQYVEEETLRPRNIHGGSNSQNSVGQSPQPVVISSTRPRDNFGFSTVPPPTTAEPFSTPPPTAAAMTQQETAQTLAARLTGRQLFQKVTSKATKNPEKYSIFFGRSTQSVNDDRLPSPGPTTVLYYGSSPSSSTTSRPIRTRSTTSSPQEYENTPSASQSSLFDRRSRSRSRVDLISSTVAPEQPASPPSTRPRGRGVRRRVRPGRRQHGKEFDPQTKYTRRRFESDRVQDREQAQKNDEIFNAEASVFRGDPTINNFFQGQRKEANSGSKSNDKDEQPQKQRQPVNPYATEQFYGRRVRPNGNNGRVPQIQNDGQSNNSSFPANNIGEGPRVPGDGVHRPEIRRRVVKRIRPKTTTAEPGSVVDNATTKKEFVVTGSTLRPVTRINVKTKLGGKIATTYRTTEITEASSTSKPSTSSTTQEPELITASEDEIEKRRQHNKNPPPSTAATQKPSFPSLKKQLPAGLSNESHLVITVLTDKHFPSSQQSTKKHPLEKKVAHAHHPGTKKSGNNKAANEEESNTRSPDYDYAYYNSDDSSDYVAETSKIDHQNYGKKPKGENK